ncbi:hypothetical protein Vi05172_g12146 [Venturia inaequalis]|nr:hypothetical protein Vi05172_g12146 [Venturia inaequalis]
MKFIPTFAALLLANTIYADYSACRTLPVDGETGRCMLYHDNGQLKYGHPPPRGCLKTSACKKSGNRCYYDGDKNGGMWYSYCNLG